MGSAREFTDLIERDFSLRTIGHLDIVNLRGDIVIEGWSQDRIRVKARRNVSAENDDEAKRLFSAMDFRFQQEKGRIEMSAEYGRNLSIEERLRERQNPRTRMDLTLLAPASMALKVWAMNGKVHIRSWNSDIDVRTAAGPVEIQNAKGGTVSVLCPECPISVRSVRAPVRCMGGSGPIEVHEVRGSPIYVESGSGAVNASKVEGDQLYVVKSGAITASRLSGHIEFHSHHGAVQVKDSDGFLSGRTQSGNIVAEMSSWKFRDKALIESVTGNITLILPSRFSGEVDLRSREGEVETDFLQQPQIGAKVASNSNGVSTRPPSQVSARIGAGGDLLQIFSGRGDVRLLKKTR